MDGAEAMIARACVVFVTLLVVIATTPVAMVFGAAAHVIILWETFFDWMAE